MMIDREDLVAWKILQKDVRSARLAQEVFAPVRPTNVVGYDQVDIAVRLDAKLLHARRDGTRGIRPRIFYAVASLL
jgi:hypothetical protein